ncbi:GntR family transcriptional regulator [Variovorax guangxiensis]|uniref:GntR family transcriptional regulator n=1 Tax=Variovorax guangxiensis TaxID=1775474 RepID=UPI0028633248|nr:GntR family transcriptional regulator [Variovorax guangxiensis]MDR6861522.1 DNA-binding GntR family transcriptional regulator [Variovorax guangxiensis]
MPVARKAARKPTMTPGSTQVEVLETEVSQVKQAYRRIEEEIATLKLEPGQAVSEKMLAARFNLGRTPVREALQQLAREGLVVILPNRGILVAEINVRRQLRLLEARRHVEGGIVAMAARRADDLQRARFAALADQMDGAGKKNDGEAFLALDGEFNQLLLAAGRNEYLALALRSMQGLSRRFWFAHYRTVADLPETARLHANIARAIACRDEKAAGKEFDELLDNVETFTRATLDAEPSY